MRQRESESDDEFEDRIHHIEEMVKEPEEGSAIGWCASCDKMFEEDEFTYEATDDGEREICSICGDWLQFGEDDGN